MISYELMFTHKTQNVNGKFYYYFVECDKIKQIPYYNNRKEWKYGY